MIKTDLTVIIPLYNKEKSVSRAIYSVLEQKIKPQNLIVIDDGSGDLSASIVRTIQKDTDFPIQLIQQSNRGVSAARNVGAKASETGFIAFLDADDEWMPEFTENLQTLIEQEPDADFYSLRYRLQSGSKMICPHVALPDNFSGIVHDFINTYHKGYGLIHSSTVCFKKEFFLKTGGFPEGETSGEDIYLWLKSALNGRIAVMNKISATVFKKEQDSIWRREKVIPYHIKYFADHLATYSPVEQKSLKIFLSKNLKLQWAAAKIEKNRWQREQLKVISAKISKTDPYLLAFAEWIPRYFFIYLRKRRNMNRDRSG